MTDKILAVDDTPESLRLLTDILKAEGYEVRSAISGALALHAATSQPPDLVLLDIRMPEMSGYEVCQRLKAHPDTRDVPVIFVSAASEIEEKIQGFEIGAVDYVTKPYQREELLARVRTHLELNRLRHHLEEMVDERTTALRASEKALRKSESLLKDANETLEKRVQEKLTELRKKDLLLIEQSRLASMGEMISNIAHQWRQPLNTLGLYFQNLKLDFDDEKLNTEALADYVSKAMQIINSMSRTIDEFRKFLRPGGEITEFAPHEILAQTISIFEASIAYHGIALRVSPGCSASENHRAGAPPRASATQLAAGLSGCSLVRGIPNQFAQVLLNVLSNARNILIERNIAAGEITISCRCNATQVSLVIGDNGGGISAEVLPKIFDPYFTTKAGSKGLGLYMSKMIMDHMGGNIEAHNGVNGAEFILTLPVNTDSALTQAILSIDKEISHDSQRQNTRG